MSIIESAQDSLKRALSADDFETAHDDATSGIKIALVRYAHLAGMSLWKVGVASWLITDSEPCMDFEEEYFRVIRNVAFGVPDDEEIAPTAHGSANEIEAEAKAFRRALLRFACFEGWRLEHLYTAITLLLGEDWCTSPVSISTMIREELTDVLGRAAA